MDKRIYTQEEYSIMDHIVNITFMNIMSLTKDKNAEIVLDSNFDFSKPEHLYFLNVCYTVSAVTNKPIKVIGHFFNKIKWNLFYRKKHDKIGYYPKRKKKYLPIILNAPEILDFMRPVFGTLKTDLTFEDIYYEYYK